MRKNIGLTLSATLVLLVLAPGCLYAWGGLGHRTIGLIAEHRLSSKALAQVRVLLGPSTTLADISRCADDIKRMPIKCGSFALNADNRSSRWHYLNIPINAAPTAETLRNYCRGHGRDDQCSTEQIKRQLGVLKDPKSDRHEKQIALMFLVHLVGDLHQPLHNADDGDAGGNAKLVRFMPSKQGRKKTNLHHIWDNLLMRDAEVKKRGPKALADQLEREIERKKPSAWVKGDVVAVAALESFNIAKTRIYWNYAQNGGADLKGEYQGEMQPIAFEQVEKAGVRLAFLLNQIWQ